GCLEPGGVPHVLPGHRHQRPCAAIAGAHAIHRLHRAVRSTPVRSARFTDDGTVAFEVYGCDAAARARRLSRTSPGPVIRIFAPALRSTSWLMAIRPHGWPNSSRVLAATFFKWAARSCRSF